MDNKQKNEEQYSKDLKKEMLALARATIEMYITKNEIPSIENVSKELKENRGAFVTLHKNGELRGCIGYTEPYFPLAETITRTAVSASTKDTRFNPVTEEEISEVDLEISVLSPVRKIEDLNEIEVGRHGLVIKKDYHSGLLLPQVATSYNWTREEFLSHTCWKAGLPMDTWKKGECDIFIFSAEVFKEKDFS